MMNERLHNRGRGDGGGFDAEDGRSEAHRRQAGRSEGSQLLVGPSAFGADEQVKGVPGRWTFFEGRSDGLRVGLGREKESAGVGSLNSVGQFRQGRNLHYTDAS